MENLPTWFQILIWSAPLIIASLSFVANYYIEDKRFINNLRINNSNQDRVILKDLFINICDVEIEFRSFTSTSSTETIKKILSDRLDQIKVLANIIIQFELIFGESESIISDAKKLRDHHTKTRKKFKRFDEENLEEKRKLSEKELKQYPVGKITRKLKELITIAYNSNSMNY